MRTLRNVIDLDFVMAQSDEDQAILMAEAAKLEKRREAKRIASAKCRALKAERMALLAV